MCICKRAGIEQHLNRGALFRQSSLYSTAAWLAVFVYIGQPLTTTAQVLTDQAATPNKRPIVDTSANGLTLIQIATPSAAGVSHNQYIQFNVDPAGLVLNNSQSAALTQQAGYVAANPNLATGTARVILNEVTSTNRSQMNGYIEVAGKQAEVIVANPNGISCNGCGFINTSRAVLTTGIPVMSINGNLDAFRVTSGDIQIGTAGLNASNLSQLDLIARSIEVNGQLWADNLNVITGANLANYSTLGVQIITASGNRPTVGIDVALLGGMYANKIHLVGTETGVGVNSLGSLTARAGDFTLDNQGRITLAGSTTAKGNLAINSSIGVSNSGLLYSQQAAQLTSAGSIVNTGLLSAQSNLTLDAASLDSAGALGAGIDTRGNATQNGNLRINTRDRTVATGMNVAGSSMSITAADISLSNSNSKAWGGITLNATAGNIDLTNSRTQSLMDNIVLNAMGTVSNASGMLLGAQVSSNASSFNNIGGSLGAYNDISLTASSLDNSNGQIGNALNGAGNITLIATSNLANTGGQINSDRDLHIAARTISGSGQIIAGRDADINLQGDYINVAGNMFKANNDLIFNTTGNLINQAILEAVKTLSVSATNIDNRAGALINANLTRITTTGNINNAGYVGGNTIETHSNNFINIASVIGGSVNLCANNLSNSGANGLIAATGSINLTIADALENHSDIKDPQIAGQSRPKVATIFSLGDINIGSDLAVDPATGYLTGNSTSVSNQSSTIEAWGNLRINADTITNKRTVLAIGANSWNGTPVVGTPSYNGAGGSPGYTPIFTQEFMAPTSTLEGLIQAGGNSEGGNAWLKAISITNDYSTIAISGIEKFSASLNQTSRTLNRVETQNKQQNNYVLQATGSYWTLCGSWIPYPCQQTSYGWVNHPSFFTTTIATPVGSVNATHTARVIQGNGSGISNQSVSIGSVGGTTATLGATLGLSQGNIATGNGPSTVIVPTGGLYTLHTQPNQTYLIVTDPRFTSYQNFISSDYMLDRLSLDPQLIQKRLGDGFYEQKLVLDQISALTGRRFLGQYANANEQYAALLDAGTGAAKELRLVPGASLTSAQVNALTSDIVWLVDRVAILPDGTRQHVLVPQVYLTRLHEADLKPGSAMIAADVINLSATGVGNPRITESNLTGNGALSNSGTIRASSALSIDANDIVNLGGTISSGGSTNLQAGNDILNQSGNINGQNVFLTAGRDIFSERLTNSIVNGKFDPMRPTPAGFTATPAGMWNFSTTLINGTTGITAADSLDISAWRDVSLAGSNVRAGGNATINTGQNLAIRTVTAKEATYNGYITTDRTEQFTGNLETGGNLTLASGNDMHLTSAAIAAGKDATLIAGGDLTLDSSKNVSSLNIETSTTKVGRYDETVIGTTINSGGNIILATTELRTNPTSSANITERGKGDIKLEGASIASKNGNITIAADATANISSVEESHNSLLETNTESKGYFTTTKRTARDASWLTGTIGSSLTGNDISITGGKDINILGSTANAGHDLSIAAMGDIGIMAATSTYGSQHYSHETTTGLQINSVFNITDIGPEITRRLRTDQTKQSLSRSTLASNSDPVSPGSGQLSILAGGNLIVGGTDLDANAGSLVLAADGSAALLAGQDILSRNDSTLIVTNPNAFTKQRRTITDTFTSIDFLGSTVQGSNVKIRSGADIVLQAAQIAPGKNKPLDLISAQTLTLLETGISLTAGGDIKLLAASDTSSSKHQETLQTDGMLIQDNGWIDYFSERRNNNQAEGQTRTADVTSLVSDGSITAHSGRDILIEASTLKARGSIDLSAGRMPIYLQDSGLRQTQGDPAQDSHDGRITFTTIKDSFYTSVADSGNSLSWQGQSGQGDYKETINLANISAGKGLNVIAGGGIVAEIPEVSSPPRPVTQSGARGIVVNPIPLTPEQVTAQRQADLEIHLQKLAKQPGQEWISQLAHDPMLRAQLQQVVAEAQHWDYSHDGLTPEAAAVIVIAVTYLSAGTAGSAAGGMTGAAAGTTTVASAAVAAGMTTLASQAAISFINNQGDIGETLDDMGKSESVRNTIAAMITAGVTQDYLRTYNLESYVAKTLTGCITGDMAGNGCQHGATTAAVLAGSTWANDATRASMKRDSNIFTGVSDTNDPSGKVFNNATGAGSAGIDGSGDRVAGTRIGIKQLQEFGTMTPVAPNSPNTLWTFAGNINPATGQPYSLTDALAAQGGFTGGTQALLPTFAGIPVSPGSFLDKLQESFAGPHDYLGGVIEGGYDDLGNWKATSDAADNIRGFMAVINIPLAIPLAIPTLLQQINFDPVAMSNTVHNETD